MSGVLKYFREIVGYADGNKIIHKGDRQLPRKEVTIVGAPKLDDLVVVPAGAEVVLWTYAAGNDFAWASFEASGYCELRWKVQAPTSGSDKTPTGTPLWLRKRMSCYGTEIFDTNTAAFAASAANLAGSSAGTTLSEGYIYEFRVYNPGTASINIERAILG